MPVVPTRELPVFLREVNGVILQVRLTERTPNSLLITPQGDATVSAAEVDACIEWFKTIIWLSYQNERLTDDSITVEIQGNRTYKLVRQENITA